MTPTPTLVSDIYSVEFSSVYNNLFPFIMIILIAILIAWYSLGKIWGKPKSKPKTDIARILPYSDITIMPKNKPKIINQSELDTQTKENKNDDMFKRI